MKTKDVPLSGVWRTCNKLRSSIFRSGLNLYEYYKHLDPDNQNLVSENKFINVLAGPLKNAVGLSDQEIHELADYFRIQDGRIFYSQMCDIIHKSVPEFSTSRYTTGLEFDDPLRENTLVPTEERKIQILMTKIAANLNLRHLVLRPYFQDYELVSKNAGVVTVAHFARVLYFLGIHLSADDFAVVVKKYMMDGYTVNYNAFLAKLDDIVQQWEQNGLTDAGGDLLQQFPGRLINAELPKLPRPEIGQVPASDIYGSQSVFHPVLKSGRHINEQLDNVMRKIQHHVLINRIRTSDSFQPFDLLNCGRLTTHQFRRGLDGILQKLQLPERDMKQVIDFYRDPNDMEQVCWRTFADDVDQVFTTKGLEKWPEHRVSVPPLEVTRLPRQGQLYFGDFSEERRDLADEALDVVKKRVAKRRINLKPFFKDYDRHNNGHVSRAQCRQCLLTNGILLSDTEMFALEDRYYDDLGFNYFMFLSEVEPEPIKEPLYDEYVKGIRQVNRTGSPNSCGKKALAEECERDIVMILAKIKAKVVRDRVDMRSFLQPHDPNKEQVMLKCNFVRALDQCRVKLTQMEVDTVAQVFAAPGRSDFIDYASFLAAVEEVTSQARLERAPLMVPCQHYPSESNPRNFLNFEERQMAGAALQKLASASIQSNLEEVLTDFDKQKCGTISSEQLLRALSVRQLTNLVSSREVQVLCKAFGFYRGLRDEVDYRGFLKAARLLLANLKRKTF